jgi:hypothetical protein
MNLEWVRCGVHALETMSIVGGWRRLKYPKAFRHWKLMSVMHLRFTLEAWELLSPQKIRLEEVHIPSCDISSSIGRGIDGFFCQGISSQRGGVLTLDFICKVMRLGGENGQFWHNRASNA